MNDSNDNGRLCGVSKWGYGQVGTWLGGMYAAFCLFVAQFDTMPLLWSTAEQKESAGGFLLAIWVIVPPIYFWVGWEAFGDEKLKTTYDLARNIWLGLILVLAYLFDIQFFG